MFKTSVELDCLRNSNKMLSESVARLGEQIRSLEFESKKVKELSEIEKIKLIEINKLELRKILETKDLEVEKAKNELRKEMQKDLITADLTRVEAVAKLSIYEKLDNKDQINQQTAMLKTAIEGLSRQIVTINQTGVK